MKHPQFLLSRRNLLKAAGAVLLAAGLSPGLVARAAAAAARRPVKRAIPSSGEMLSLMGIGTSRTFDLGGSEMTGPLVPVLQAFFDHGGQLIDSSPMYGNAESVVGELLQEMTNAQGLFAASKVWTDGREAGIEQMNRSMQRMGVKVMDLMQVHNLRDWKIHLHTLRDWKERGRIRYLGITTSHGRYHEAFEHVMKTEALDFVQFSYNIADRAAEERLLPLAADRGIATLVNRPYRKGALFRKVKNKPLPLWAGEFDCASWGQFFLKFIAGHPAVTCIIPATTKTKHVVDNMTAGYGRVPGPKTRRKMVTYFEGL